MDKDLLKNEILDDIEKEFGISENRVSIATDFDDYTEKHFLSVEIENEGGDSLIAKGCKEIIHNNLYNLFDIDVSETLIDVDNCEGTLVLSVYYRED